MHLTKDTGHKLLSRVRLIEVSKRKAHLLIKAIIDKR